MLLDQSFRRQRWFWATVPAALSGVLALAAPGAAYAQAMHEITVTISEVRMLDRGDVPIAGQADLYAVVTIGGEVLKTQRVRNQDRITPNWTLSKKVAPGNHDIKVQIVDKDIFKPDDQIDINKVAAKRHLDLGINTRNCRISGFSNGYRCGDAIKRAGEEKKKAEITFSVNVKK